MKRENEPTFSSINVGTVACILVNWFSKFGRIVNVLRTLNRVVNTFCYISTFLLSGSF